MAGGGKKFNVWIAYSDIFSNLSVFLFISAFGLFAALGSAEPMDYSTSIQNWAKGRCDSHQLWIVKLMHQSVKQTDGNAVGSDWDAPKTGIPSEDVHPCRDFVVLDKNDSSWRQARVESTPGETKMSAINKVCVPIWRMITRGLMQNDHGLLTLVGTANDDGTEACTGENLRHWMPHAQSIKTDNISRPIALQAYVDCNIHIHEGRFVYDTGGVTARERKLYQYDMNGTHEKLESYCQKIVDCRNEGPDVQQDDCERLEGLTDKYMWGRNACLFSTAQNMAEQLYKFCETAPSRSINTKPLTDDTKATDATKDWDPSSLRSTVVRNGSLNFEAAKDAWRHHVRFEGMMVAPPQKDKPAWPANTVIVRMDFAPDVPKIPVVMQDLRANKFR